MFTTPDALSNQVNDHRRWRTDEAAAQTAAAEAPCRSSRLARAALRLRLRLRRRGTDVGGAPVFRCL